MCWRQLQNFDTSRLRTLRDASNFARKWSPLTDLYVITDARKKVPTSKQVEVKPANMLVDLWIGRTSALVSNASCQEGECENYAALRG